MVFSQKHWKTVEVDEALADNLARELDVPRPIAVVLVGRGLGEPEKAEQFLNPRLSDLSDPFILPGMTDAVKHIWDAILDRRKIAIYGDYDADGITGTALLVSVLQTFGGCVDTFLPSRLLDGYGLTVGALSRCIEIHKPDLIITVDCGTGSIEAVEAAGRAGVDVIVTDHHEISGACAPALAVVNPKLGDNENTMALAGVGTVFKLCHALIKYGLEKQRQEVADIDLRNWLDLVAIGTVADIVPLLCENRILVRHGLALINGSDQKDIQAGSRRAGLKALIQVARIQTRIDCYHLGFIIGPRLNAAGRLGSAETALELLLTSDPDRARHLAGELDAANSERKRIEEAIVTEAVREIDDYFDEDRNFGLVAGRKGWHVGTIGIVAAKLCSRYRRPAAVIAFDEHGHGRGSCRSIESVNIVDVLRECADLLVSSGGHEMAAGLAMESGKLDAFRSRFNELCAAKLDGRDLRQVRNVDSWITLGEADERLFTAIQKLKPLGMGNPTPTWGVSNVRLVGRPRKVGKDHLKMIVASGGSQLDAIAFGMAEREVPEGPMDILFYLQENTYMGRQSLQLNVKDFRPANSKGGNM